MDHRSAQWRTSSRSGSAGNCVEVATNVHGVVLLRDSKDRGGAQLTVSPAAWQAFLRGVRGGEFDR